MTKTDGSFLRSFLPGLVIGVIIGASAAVLLPETLNRPKIVNGFTGEQSSVRDVQPRDHDEMPLTIEGESVEEPEATDDDSEG